MTPNEFRQCILPIKDKLYRFALRMVGDQKEAEDILQDVLIKLWNNRDKLASLVNLNAWSMRIVKNQALDRMKSKQFQTRSLDRATDIILHDDNAYHESELSDILKHIHRMMDRLPLVQKQIIQLKDIDGFSYDEIATIMELSLTQVKVYLFRARTTIRSGMTTIASYGTDK